MKLIDHYLPVYQYHEMHSIDIDAPSAFVFQSALQYKMEDDSFINGAIFLRELPEKFLKLLDFKQSINKEPFNLNNFTFLESVKNEDILYGLIGRFWSKDYGLVEIKNNSEFLKFNEAGIPKLVFSLSINNINENNTKLITQTRIFCPDKQSYYKFMPYWYIIRLVSGIIRKRMLKAIKKDAEKK